MSSEKKRPPIGVLPPECIGMLAEFLDDLSDRMGNAGCNDFDLAARVPDVKVRREIMRKAEEQNGSPEDFDPRGKYETVMDFQIVNLLAAWVREQAASPPTTT